MKNKYVVAVSGGVDSVVLLDMMSRRGDVDAIVAHFDHGIRDDSLEDRLFVGELASTYGFPYEFKREELGSDASEDLARVQRYAFLREVAKKYDARIMTAHHQDDLIETVALNFMRGTGWRGLAVFDSPDIDRPLLDMTKQDIYDYAVANDLEWREDSTNNDMKYARNRVRPRVKKLSTSDKGAIHDLYKKQRALKVDVMSEIEKIVKKGGQQSRYLLTASPVSVAMDILRYLTDDRLTRPQLNRLLLAIKTAKNGTVFQAGAGVEVAFSTRYFKIEMLK